MDYYKLGETAGKAWRLMHMGASLQEKIDAETQAASAFVKPNTPMKDRNAHYRGFSAGVSAVDENAAQMKQEPEKVTLTLQWEQAQFLLNLLRETYPAPADPHDVEGKSAIRAHAIASKITRAMSPAEEEED